MSHMEMMCLCSGRSYLLGAVNFFLTFRGFESVPTVFHSVKVFFSREGIYFVVTHVFRHQRTSKARDLQTPTHGRIYCTRRWLSLIVIGNRHQR